MIPITADEIKRIQSIIHKVHSHIRCVVFDKRMAEFGAVVSEAKDAYLHPKNKSLFFDSRNAEKAENLLTKFKEKKYEEALDDLIDEAKSTSLSDKGLVFGHTSFITFVIDGVVQNSMLKEILLSPCEEELEEISLEGTKKLFLKGLSNLKSFIADIEEFTSESSAKGFYTDPKSNECIFIIPPRFAKYGGFVSAVKDEFKRSSFISFASDEVGAGKAGFICGKIAIEKEELKAQCDSDSKALVSFTCEEYKTAVEGCAHEAYRGQEKTGEEKTKDGDKTESKSTESKGPCFSCSN